MGILGFLLTFICGIGLIARFVTRKRVEWPSFSGTGLTVGLAVGLSFLFFHQIFFYAQPGYIYHVRTFFGEEKVVSNVGWNTYTFGWYNS